MTAKDIYSKTMIFNWLKLGLGAVTILASVILLGICLGLGLLFGETGTVVMLLIWLIGTGTIHFVIMHYFGYLVKAGHVAMIASAVTTGRIPENQFEVAKQMVQNRFATANVYFAIDKLVGGAVKQLQRMLEGASNLLGNIPGMDIIVKIGKLFIDISLGYVDECCLGYTFCNQDQNAYKSAADGVVIYFQNWKKLLKNAALTTAIVVGLMVAATIVAFLMLGGLFALFGWDKTIAFILSVFVAFVVKFAFIDGWILVKMMVSYMEVAPTTEITFDLYDKLCGISGKFKDLLGKGQNQRSSSSHLHENI